MDPFAELWKALLAGGPWGIVAGVFAFMWWVDRKKLDKAQETILEMLKATVVADNAVSNSLAANTKAMEGYTKIVESLITTIRGGKVV